jgi:hypothetical protein
MVHVILGSVTEETYSALFAFDTQYSTIEL